MISKTIRKLNQLTLISIVIAKIWANFYAPLTASRCLTNVHTLQYNPKCIHFAVQSESCTLGSTIPEVTLCSIIPKVYILQYHPRCVHIAVQSYMFSTYGLQYNQNVNT